MINFYIYFFILVLTIFSQEIKSENLAYSDDLKSSSTSSINNKKNEDTKKEDIKTESNQKNSKELKTGKHNNTESHRQDENYAIGNGVKIGDHLKLLGLAEASYAYDYNKPPDRQRQYSSNPYKSNEVEISYAYLGTHFESENIKFNFSLHTGGIVRYFYANEPDEYKYIRSANVSYCFIKAVCVDAGIFPSIYGAETFVSKENLHASRAMMTDFAPDFEAGFKLSFKFSERLSGKIQITNGWQIIQDNNKDKSVGSLLQYEISHRLLLNWGTYLGNDRPDKETPQMRLYNNLFARYTLGRFTFAPMLDVTQQKMPDKDAYYKSVNMALTVRYQIIQQFAIAARAERYRDPVQLILASNTKNGVQVDNYTLTLEYTPLSNVIIRLEGRTFHSKDKIYIKTDNYNKDNKYSVDQQRYVNTDQFLLLSTSVWF